MMLLFAACTDPAMSLPGNVERGAALYDAQCTPCHGSAGEGTSRGPILSVPITDAAARDTVDAIRFGVGTMPPFELDDQELADLLAWIRR